MDYCRVVDHVVTVFMSIFVGRLLTASECDLHEDYRMGDQFQQFDKSVGVS